MERIAILRMGDLLLVTIQVDMHDQLALSLQDDLTTTIERTGARGVLIDISALEMVDSFIGRIIANISAMSRILDAAQHALGLEPDALLPSRRVLRNHGNMSSPTILFVLAEALDQLQESGYREGDQDPYSRPKT